MSDSTSTDKTAVVPDSPSPVRRLLAAAPWRLWTVIGSLLVVIVLAGLWLYSIYGPLDQGALRQQQETLTGVALSDAAAVQAEAQVSGTASPSALISPLSTSNHLRITLVGPDGTVLADTAHSVDEMQNHLDRPEVAAALGGSTGTDVRVSRTDSIERVYASAPVELSGTTYALCVSLPLSNVRGVPVAAREASTLLLIVGVFAALIILCITIRLASRPVRRLESVRRDFTRDAAEQLDVPAATIRQLSGDVASAARAGDLAAVQALAPHLDYESVYLEQTVDRLRRLAALEDRDGRQGPLQTASFSQAVHASFETHRQQAAERGLSLELADATAQDDTCLVGLSDAVAELICDGLIDNALRYTDRGGVTLRLSATSDLVKLQVVDTGAGIAPAEQERIFERFYRGEAARRLEQGGTAAQGAGLGLSLVRHAVKRAHGSVGLASEEGRGSTFTILLPRVSEPLEVVDA